jgi:hypothetical protein
MTIPAILLYAIALVESGNNPHAIGDNGKAFGPYQLHAAYVQDAAEFAKVEWIHHHAFHDQIVEDIIRAYMARYATPERIGRPVTAEDIARIHNGGPNGYRRNATLGYWAKVQAELNRLGAWQLADGRAL